MGAGWGAMHMDRLGRGRQRLASRRRKPVMGGGWRGGVSRGRHTPWRVEGAQAWPPRGPWASLGLGAACSPPPHAEVERWEAEGPWAEGSLVPRVVPPIHSPTLDTDAGTCLASAATGAVQ